MTSLKSLVDDLYADAQRRKIFWHYAMPINYGTEKLYQGLNFLILGLNSKTLQDPRWGVVQDYQKRDFYLSDEAQVEHILYWEESFLSQRLYSIPVFSVTDSSDFSSFIKEFPDDLDLIDFLKNHQIPYIESENSSYSPLDKKLYINTDSSDDKVKNFYNAISAISRFIVHNYEFENEPLMKGIERLGLPKFLMILDDLVMFKISFDLGVRINKCIDEDLVCEAISYFYENNKRSALLTSFVLADKIINSFYERKVEANDILLDFLTEEKGFELLKTISRQEILEIEENMRKVKTEKQQDTAFLHFCSFEDDLSLDFYVTSYDEESEEPILGTMIINGDEVKKISYTQWDLCSQYEIDTLFTPCSLQSIIHQ